MAEGVFNENQDFLIEARNIISEREEVDRSLSEKKAELKKLDKAVAQEDRSIQDEISSTISKRRSDLDARYNKQLTSLSNERKAVEAKKSKKKTQQMNENVKDSTKGLRKENSNYKDNLKYTLKENNVPSFCSSKLFYIMFMPSGISEILICLGIFAVGVALLPALISLIFRVTVFSDMAPYDLKLWTIIVAAACIILFILIYVLIYINVKVRNIDVLRQTREMMTRINLNNKNIESIKKSITSDLDESKYDLREFDSKIAEIDEKQEALNYDRKNDLANFDEKVKHEIQEEIESRRIPKLTEMQSNLAELQAAVKELQDKSDALSTDISRRYAVYLGEDMCRSDKLDKLIQIMEDGDASTVSEAVSVYKGK